jgi:Flp pilus assembly protein TadG
MTSWIRARLHAGDDEGSAIVEFVFIAILIMVPLVYVVVAVAVVQRSRAAVTGAARDVGRAIASSDTTAEAKARAVAALRLALDKYGYDPSEVEQKYVDANAECSAAAITPSLALGSEFAVCVTRHDHLQAVPTVLSDQGIVTIGRYVVRLDRFRRIG